MHPRTIETKNWRAFTIVELLAVTAILTILAALLLSGMKTVTAKGQDTKCLSNQRQIYTAMMHFVQDNDGMLPVTWKSAGNNWLDQLSTYVDAAQTAGGNYPPVYFCPTWKSKATINKTGYGFNSFLLRPDDQTWTQQNVPVRMVRLRDPASKIAFGDSIDWHLYVPSGTWQTGVSGDPSRHHGAAFYTFFDGHAALLKPDEALDTLVNH